MMAVQPAATKIASYGFKHVNIKRIKKYAPGDFIELAPHISIHHVAN